MRGYFQPVRPGAPDHSDPSGPRAGGQHHQRRSVFLGDWSPESAGDYASGTNHVLPTYGYTATCSSLGLADFQKRMTVQELSRDGFAALASTIEILAAAERLDAHKNAVTLRVAALKEQA
ncbi:histidinol dehydrogenase [Klebsiella pneumoniae]|nr:histidinol dehydrogenase [Klebsiella pneumoniae]